MKRRGVLQIGQGNLKYQEKPGTVMEINDFCVGCYKFRGPVRVIDKAFLSIASFAHMKIDPQI